MLPQVVSLGVVGTNLRDLAQQQRHPGVGYGVALIPIQRPGDRGRRVHRFTADNQTGRKGTALMGGGGPDILAGRSTVRLGGGYDAATGNGFASAGVSAVSEVGAIDAGIRQDVVVHAGGRRETVVAVSLRLFIPSQQPSLTAAGNLMTATLSETAWRPHCAEGGNSHRSSPIRAAAAGASTLESRRSRLARARSLGQRAPYTMSVAERLLIARLNERDEQAFSEIVRLYGDKVFSLIYRMLGNRHEAEDVAQEVFITVFKTIDSFRGEAKFSTWLLRIAANHAQEPDQVPGAPADRRRRAGRRAQRGQRCRTGPRRRCRRRSTRPTSCSRRREMERLMQEAIAALRRGAPPAGRLARRRRDVVPGDRGDHRSARRDDKIAPAPGAHGDQRRAGQAHAIG